MSEPAEPRRHRPWLHRYVILCAVATVFLLFVGGLVTTTDSGDAVPDWWFLPLSFGTLFPAMEGGVLYEHGHRLVASVVGLLTIGLAGWTWGAGARRTVRRLALVALGAVIVQGILGGIRVFRIAPTLVAVIHACLAQGFFCLLVALAVLTSRDWTEGSAEPVPVDLRPLCVAATAACFVQLVLGAVTRHTGAGLDLHLMGAGGVALLCGWAAIRARALALGGLLVAQLSLGLGAWAITSSGVFRRSVDAAALHVGVVTGHLAVGALLLATALALTLRTWAPRSARPTVEAEVVPA